jgi:cytochrome o ubiquinol oxidase operon protein cyoD
MKEKDKKSHGTISSLSIGFVLSILLTLSAYLLVTQELMPSSIMAFVVIFLALMQFVVQMLFFLHLDKESGPRWNLIVFMSTISFVLVVLLGSLWIMNHLNYNMTPDTVNLYMQDEEGIHK